MVGVWGKRHHSSRGYDSQWGVPMAPDRQRRIVNAVKGMSAVKVSEEPDPATGARPLAEPEAGARLRGMMLIRLLLSVLVFFLGPMFFQSRAPTLYFFTGALFFLTVIYALLLQWGFHPLLSANVQIFADVFLVTLLITLTGWEDSKFGFLYIIPITTASLFFHLRESVSVAVLSSFLYAAVLLFHRFRLAPGSGSDGLEFFYALYVRTIIFCVVGFLCGYLANLLRKQKEELREVKGFRDLILASMDNGVITTDNSNNIVYTNRAARRMLGFPANELYNKKVEELLLDRENRSVARHLDKAMAGPEDAEGIRPELEAKTARGSTIPIGFSLSPVRNGLGKQVGKVMVFSDLTRVKALEKRLRAVEKFRTAGELAAGIAHEIRNPLTSITGSIEMLAETEELSRSNKELLSVTLKESARLNRIIEDFLAYARRGSLDLKKEDLCGIVKDCVEMLCRANTLPGRVRLNLIAPTEPVMVSADKALMGQVFLNLLNNAVDAVGEAGSISTVIEGPTAGAPDARGDKTKSVVEGPSYAGFPEPSPENGQYCRVKITDTGPGIPQDRVNRAFEPFFTTKKDGVGIGLCIAERIIRDHNGYIDITSKEGKGTSVTVVIPTGQAVVVAKTPSALGAAKASCPPQERKSEETERIPSPWGTPQPVVKNG